MNLTKNVGATDKWVRYGIAVALVLVMLFAGLPLWANIVAGIAALIMVVTASINFCPIWAAIRFNTRGE